VKSLEGFAAMALELVEVEVGLGEALHLGLEKVAVKIETTAKDEIGHYQDAVGPFPAWPLLADSTEERKAALGYPLDSPLYATGEMQDSIGHETQGLEALIGATDEKMVFHEFGTKNMPARPVLGPAAYTNKPAIELLVGAAVVAGFVGGDRIHEALGYDMKTSD